MLGELIPCGGGDAIPLLGRKLMVGRRPSCDIVLPFPNVSSHHCELELKDGHWNVKDLGSSNGIKVNGERCNGKVLYPGDELSVGKHAFRIQYTLVGATPEDEEEAAPSPTSMSLLEKAGLEAERVASRLSPEAAREKRRRKQTRRAASEDDFLMEWFPEE